MSLHRPAAPAALLASLLLLPALARALPPAPAEPPSEADRQEASRLLEDGRTHRRHGHFEEAISTLQRAWSLAGDPEALLELSSALRAAGRIEEAVEALERFLQLRPEDRRAASLHARLRAMRRLAERRRAEGLGGGATGHEEEPDAAQGPGEAAGPEAGGREAAAAGSPQVVSEPEVERGGSAVPWILVGLGGGLGAAAVVTGVMALDAAADLESQCAPQPDGTWLCPDPGYADVKRRGAMLATATDVLATVSLLTAGAGLALWLFENGERPGPAATLSGACGPRSCSAALRVRF